MHKLQYNLHVPMLHWLQYTRHSPVHELVGRTENDGISATDLHLGAQE